MSQFSTFTSASRNNEYLKENTQFFSVISTDNPLNIKLPLKPGVPLRYAQKKFLDIIDFRYQAYNKDFTPDNSEIGPGGIGATYYDATTGLKLSSINLNVVKASANKTFDNSGRQILDCVTAYPIYPTDNTVVAFANDRYMGEAIELGEAHMVQEFSIRLVWNHKEIIQSNPLYPGTLQPSTTISPDEVNFVRPYVLKLKVYDVVLD